MTTNSAGVVSKRCLFYTRHYPPCTRTDINHRRCRCPKWMQGTLPDGRSIRTSAQTRSWDKAEIKMRGMEDAADPHKPAVKAKVTIAEVIQSFRDDEKSRQLNKHFLKKSEFFFEKLERLGGKAGSRIPGSIDRSRAYQVPAVQGG